MNLSSFSNDFKKFLATVQIFSIPLSLLSLIHASAMLYYSQRLGSFKELDPSWKLKGIIVLFNLLQTGPIVLVWVFLLTYLQGWIFFIFILIYLPCISISVLLFHFMNNYDDILDGISPHEVIYQFRAGGKIIK